MPTHAQRKVLRYTPQQMFDLVADVGRYPEFLPWCAACRVISREEDRLIADMTIGFKVFRETFRSDVRLKRPDLIQVRYLNGPFRYLNNTWKFIPHPQGVEVDFFVDFEFRSAILRAAIGVVFNEAVQLMVRAFERRAMMLYGRSPPAPAPGAALPSSSST
ncbi:MAG: type II toxin-antitoxin system RatA family toxin [Rhodovarius sp.]|nr:type II toxin-antitoxin system RatA family toxin [Rhodovarius sp.]MCX7931992.1 type II toxin-antitoxin system RatA family toxin [Rhodovarius sp.]MDW8313955.1 type II toxin-antitoxin system RatA family toxin [Rhodovarius sp.]